MMANLLQGDCLLKLKELADNSVDSIVTDPPYGLSFMGKKWDYDVPTTEIWEECLRVLKPGGHLLAFFGTRTYHRGVIKIEDAGFEIRDQIQWIYGSGFPKSHSIDKAIDKTLGVEREIVGTIKGPGTEKMQVAQGAQQRFSHERPLTSGDPLTDEAKKWAGWGTALKPANEPIVVARKPLEKGLTIAENVMKWGTGALNIDASRIGVSAEDPNHRKPSVGYADGSIFGIGGREGQNLNPQGRWPANVLFDEYQEHVLQLKDSVIDDISSFIRGVYASYGPLSGLQKEDHDLSESENADEVLQQEMLLRSAIAEAGADDGQGAFEKINYQNEENETAEFQERPGQPNLEGTLVFEGLQAHQYNSIAPTSTNDSETHASKRPGFFAGTSCENGLENGSTTRKVRSGTPQERNQRRQSNSESRIKRHESTQERTLGSAEGSSKAPLLVRESDVPEMWLRYFEGSGFTVRSGSASVLDEQSGECKTGSFKRKARTETTIGLTGYKTGPRTEAPMHEASSGGASRFFYCAKASKRERNAGCDLGVAKRSEYRPNDDGTKGIQSRLHGATEKIGNHHPTVKPVKLMEYLITLVTPPNGSALDPFMGSGTTGVAAKNLNRAFIGIELSEEYFAIAQKRIG